MDFSPFYITFKLAVFTTIILFLVGIPISYLIAVPKWKGKAIVESVLMLPIILPPTVLGYYFLVYLGPDSSLGHFLEENLGLSLAFTFEGILLGSVIFCTPFMLSPLINGFRSIPKPIYESTKMLNKRKINALWFVYLPYLKGAMLNGILLTFAHTIGEFGIILMIGGKFETTRVASVAIYDEMNAMNFELVDIYALILLITSFVLILTINLIGRTSKLKNRA